MSTFTVTSATDIDQDSPLTGRNSTSPQRDSLMEGFRENDAYIYERLFRSQQGTGNEYGFETPITTDYIDPTGVAIYTGLGGSTTDGIKFDQLDHWQQSFSVSIYRPDIVTPATGAATVDFSLDISSGLYVWGVGYYFDDELSTVSTLNALTSRIDIISDGAGGLTPRLIIAWTGLNVGADAAASGYVSFWRVA